MSFVSIAYSQTTGTTSPKSIAASLSVLGSGIMPLGAIGLIKGAQAGERKLTATGESPPESGMGAQLYKIAAAINKSQGSGLPSIGDPKITEAQRAARLSAYNAGRAGTILTGRLGLTEQATVEKKTLLGQ